MSLSPAVQPYERRGDSQRDQWEAITCRIRATRSRIVLAHDRSPPSRPSAAEVPTTPAGIVIVMIRRLSAAVVPTRCAQPAGERIHSGRPAGVSNSGDLDQLVRLEGVAVRTERSRHVEMGDQRAKCGESPVPVASIAMIAAFSSAGCRNLASFAAPGCGDRLPRRGSGGRSSTVADDPASLRRSAPPRGP